MISLSKLGVISSSDSFKSSSSESSASSYCGTCAQCGQCIDGTTYMFDDRAYCCQRHRLQAVQAQAARIRAAKTTKQPSPTVAAASNLFSSWCSISNYSTESAAPTSSSLDQKQPASPRTPGSRDTCRAVLTSLEREQAGWHYAGDRSYYTWV